MRTVPLLSLLMCGLGLTMAACTKDVPAPLGGTDATTTGTASRPVKPVANACIYQFTPNSIQGVPTPLKQFKGRKLLIVNVASRCGYTPQYADLERLYQQYGNRVVVLGFPCNQFGAQEPDGDSTIYQNCVNNYGVTFPMFSKIDVKGPNQAPIYQFLADLRRNGRIAQVPSWNFAKYLIDENGYVIRYFTPATNPMDPTVINAVLR